MNLGMLRFQQHIIYKAAVLCSVCPVHLPYWLSCFGLPLFLYEFCFWLSLQLTSHTCCLLSLSVKTLCLSPLCLHCMCKLYVISDGSGVAGVGGGGTIL